MNSPSLYQPEDFQVIEGEPEPQDEDFFEVIDLGTLIPENGSDLMELDDV